MLGDGNFVIMDIFTYLFPDLTNIIGGAGVFTFLLVLMQCLNNNEDK